MPHAIYDNGTNLSDAEGRRLQERAMTQEDIITAFFERHKGRPYTPWEVHHATGRRIDINSVRRTLTNLTGKNVLVKRTDIKRQGDKDVKNNTWMMPGKKQLEMF